MAQSGQKLSQTGGYNIGAHTRVTFDPGLRDSSGGVLTPTHIKVIPEGVAIVVSRGTGTFDLQNITSVARQVYWLAEFNHSVTQPDNQTAQAGVDSVTPPSTNGVDPSATAALPINADTVHKDITTILAGPSAPTLAQLRNGFIELGSALAHVSTLPTAVQLAALDDGLITIFKRNGAALVTITAGAGSTIEYGANITLPIDGDSVTLVYNSNANNWEAV